MFTAQGGFAVAYLLQEGWLDDTQDAQDITRRAPGRVHPRLDGRSRAEKSRSPPPSPLHARRGERHLGCKEHKEKDAEENETGGSKRRGRENVRHAEADHEAPLGSR